MVSVLTAILLMLPFGGPEGITRDKILGNGQEWQENYDAFKAEPELLDLLKSKMDEHLRIDVYLGLWCSDSRNTVPPFIKIIDNLNSSTAVRYYAVERKPSQDIKYFVEGLQVERVPTFIVYRDDKEIGRIIENPKATLLDDLIQIIMSSQ